MSWLLIFFTLILFRCGIASDDPGNQGVIPHDERGEGYRMVKNGTIRDCGIDTTQQCFHIKPFKNLSMLTLFNTTVLDVKCQSDGFCSVPFDFDQEGQKLAVFVNCLDNAGFKQNAYVRMDLGKGSVDRGDPSAYSFFVARGYNITAKWKSDPIYTSNVSLRDV